MSCVLRASGITFDPDAFCAASTLEPDNVFRRGEPRLPTQPDAPVNEHSGVSVLVSNADLSDLSLQVEDALAFLSEQRAHIEHLISFPGIESATLDFGVAWRETLTHADSLPVALLKLVGELGLGITISHYPVSEA